MKTVLVTGATGMIGANVCERLIKQGDQVRAIARKPEAPDAIALRALGVDVRSGDITDLDCVSKPAKTSMASSTPLPFAGCPGRRSPTVCPQT